MHDWRDHDLLRRALALFGLETLAERADAPEDVRALARERADAREAGDWAEADRLRGEIESRGWVVRDVQGDGGFQLVPRT